MYLPQLSKLDAMKIFITWVTQRSCVQLIKQGLNVDITKPHKGQRQNSNLGKIMPESLVFPK